MPAEIFIKGRRVGRDHPPYIIAELSANHNGSFEQARKSIEVAKSTGAHAVKLQTYTPDTMTINCDSASLEMRDHDDMVMTIEERRRGPLEGPKPCIGTRRHGNQLRRREKTRRGAAHKVNPPGQAGPR